MKKLGNKAVGIDRLKDSTLKKAAEDKTSVNNISKEFKRWLVIGKMPDYCTTARVIPLSK